MPVIAHFHLFHQLENFHAVILQDFRCSQSDNEIVLNSDGASYLGMATVGHGRLSVGHDRSEAFDRPTDLTDRLV